MANIRSRVRQDMGHQFRVKRDPATTATLSPRQTLVLDRVGRVQKLTGTTRVLDTVDMCPEEKMLTLKPKSRKHRKAKSIERGQWYSHAVSRIDKMMQ